MALANRNRGTSTEVPAGMRPLGTELPHSMDGLSLCSLAQHGEERGHVNTQTLLTPEKKILKSTPYIDVYTKVTNIPSVFHLRERFGLENKPSFVKLDGNLVWSRVALDHISLTVVPACLDGENLHLCKQT